MPITYKPKNPIHGISMKSALKGEECSVCHRANFSSSDGNEFLLHVEALWGYFETKVKTRPSQVDNFLAILSPQDDVTVYCNELNQVTKIRVKEAIDAGQQITKDQIAEINEVNFATADGNIVEFPSDSGIVIIISHGWRKSIFYDFGPLTNAARTIDVAKIVGQQLSAMMFQEICHVPDGHWDRMIDWGWFPFIGLTDKDRLKVVNFSTRQDEPREIVQQVCQDYRPRIAQRVESWKKKNVLQNHIPFLETALERLIADDFLASISTLYPRIEGVMRSLDLIENPNEGTGQTKMVDNLVAHLEGSSLLLPKQFKQYLRKFYFRSFNYVEGNLPLSRHTVGHGLSRAEDYNLKNATLGFLIFDQLFYYLR